MKKYVKLFLILILIGVSANLTIYFVVKNANADDNIVVNDNVDNEIENQNNTQKDKEQQEKNEKEKKYFDYFNVEREKIDRPIAYVINNITQALPQSGVYGADYVYEMKVEGGLTRLLTVFTRGDIDKIGPIRSARHNFLDISMEYDAIFAHHGGSPQAYTDLKDLNIANLDGMGLDGLMYWRDLSRIPPHNSYTSIEKTLNYSNKYGYNKIVEPNHFNFSKKDFDLDGDVANKVNINYSRYHTTNYVFDSDNKVYKRYMNNKSHVDKEINSQLIAKNIIIQFAKHVSIDNEDRQDISLVNSGLGFYVTNGKYIKINWKKTSRAGQTKFYDEQGNEIILNKGQTWIQIVPLDSRVSITR